MCEHKSGIINELASNMDGSPQSKRGGVLSTVLNHGQRNLQWIMWKSWVPKPPLKFERSWNNNILTNISLLLRNICKRREELGETIHWNSCNTARKHLSRQIRRSNHPGALYLDGFSSNRIHHFFRRNSHPQSKISHSLSMASNRHWHTAYHHISISYGLHLWWERGYQRFSWRLHTYH